VNFAIGKDCGSISLKLNVDFDVSESLFELLYLAICFIDSALEIARLEFSAAMRAFVTRSLYVSNASLNFPLAVRTRKVKVFRIEEAVHDHSV